MPFWLSFGPALRLFVLIVLLVGVRFGSSDFEP